MHREISHTDEAFHQESNLSLYLLTALVGLLIALDLWPAFATWEPLKSLGLPSWPREFYGPYRFALLAAVASVPLHVPYPVDVAFPGEPADGESVGRAAVDRGTVDSATVGREAIGRERAPDIITEWMSRNTRPFYTRD